MRVVIVSARSGWHTNELIRAFTERGHLAALVPYEGLTARFRSSHVEADLQARMVPSAEAGLQTRLTSEQISLLDADVVLARIIPGVCGVLWSSASGGTTRTPWLRQSLAALASLEPTFGSVVGDHRSRSARRS